MRRINEWLERLSLVDRFRLAMLIILLLGLVGVGSLVSNQIDDGVIRVTSSTTALYMESLVAPQLSELATEISLSQSRIATLDRLLADTPLGQQVVAFKVWARDGEVIYDTDHANIGRVFPVEDRLARAFSGETTARISSLEADENAHERQLARLLLETYSPIHVGSQENIVAVAEFYQKVDLLQAAISRAQTVSWLVATAAMVLIYLLLVSFVNRASRIIARQQKELSDQVIRLSDLLAVNADLNERVRGAAARTAALNERFLRRIGAELHDGPIQDLSLALLRIEPPAADTPGDPGQTGGDRLIETSLRHALEEVRAIAAGLGLPELDALTLPEVVNRVVQVHERRTGTRVDLRIVDVPDEASPPIKITVYRLVQEALNNAYRHAGGAGQAVCAAAHDDALTVTIADAGPGFTPRMGGWEQGAHLGLDGMRERVQSLGGVFRIDSAPGQGTTISASFSLRVAEEEYDG